MDGLKEKKTKQKLPLLLKKRIAEEVLTGIKEPAEAAREYSIPYSTVKSYARQFGSEILRAQAEELVSSPLMEEPLNKKTTDQEKQIQSLEEENLLLKKKLLELNLQREALNTLIDLAEENYGISLRKNSGAKQSKD